MKISCDNCGDVTEVILDGYSVGDRQLEDCDFKVTLVDGQVTVDTKEDWSKNSYTKGLNKDYWLKRAQQCAEDWDVFQCCKCGDDAYVEVEEESAI